MPINYKEVIEFIFTNLDNKNGDEILIKQLVAKFGLSDTDGEWAIEMFRTGAFRAGFIQNGLNLPKSNIDNDPFLIEAIKIISDQPL